jgi:hypothetical protein
MAINNPHKRFALLQERDFGEVLNASITFIKTFGRPLYKALLYFVIPISLLYGIFIGLFTKNLNGTMLNLLKNPGESNPFDILLSWSYGGALLLSIIESLLILAVVYGFFSLHLNGEKEFSLNTIWNEAKKRILPLIGTISLLGAIFIGAVFLFSLLVGIIGAAFSSVAAGPFMIFILVLGMFFGLMALSTFLSMAIPANIIEKKGAFDAISRSFALVSGNWGQTFLVLLVTYIVVFTLSGIFSLPAAIAQWMVTFNSLEDNASANTPLLSSIIVAGSCLSTLGSALVTPILHICTSMQFFNLVEKKDGLGMKNMIDTFGTSSDDEAPEEEY